MDDDLEEMRTLRDAKIAQPTSSDRMDSEITGDGQNSAQSLDVESVGTEKKARTFDFMTMFEQARQTAIDRTQVSEELEEEVDESSMKKSKKKSHKHKKKKKKRSRAKSNSDSDSESADVIGPPLPPSSGSDKSVGGFKPLSSLSLEPKSDDENDFIGPPVPVNVRVSDNFSSLKIENVEITGPPAPSVSQHQSKAVGQLGDNEEDDGMIGPPIPPQKDSDDDDEEEEDEEEEEDSLEKLIPASHEIIFNHGNKTVSALALDPAGARLVTGGFDYDVKFYDFAGMDASLREFRTFRPCESHTIKTLQYSMTGDMVLVVAGNSQAKIVDRDGFEKMECPRGDPYLVDMSSTKGHIAMLNSGCWHPRIKDEFMTCSNDSTVRLWTVGQDKRHKSVIKPKSAPGRKTIPTACTYSTDGNLVAAACQDGSIQLWDHRKTFVNVALMNRSAHMNGSDTSCLCFSYDGKALATRGGDDTLKLWDIRHFKQPLQVKEDLYNHFPMTDCIFSPDDRMVVTGLSLRKGESKGKLVFFDRETLNEVCQIEPADSSIVRCLWHPKLNQFAVGCGNGKVKLYYDPRYSRRGALLCTVKRERKSKTVQFVTSKKIITPYALPMYREQRQTSTKKFEERVRKDPVKTKRPDLPVTGPGTGGRLAVRGATLSQYVSQQLVRRKPDLGDQDVRQAILRHADNAEQNPYWVTPAYSYTQPRPIFQEEEEKKEADDIQPVWKKQKKQ